MQVPLPLYISVIFRLQAQKPGAGFLPAPGSSLQFGPCSLLKKTLGSAIIIPPMIIRVLQHNLKLYRNLLDYLLYIPFCLLPYPF